jgi:pimeloyl-ACP methyl ester carboxylesterase
MTKWCNFLVLGALTVGGPGAAAEEAVPAKPGIVIVVGGVGGWDCVGTGAQAVLPHLGVGHEIRSFPWGHGYGNLLRDLQDIRHILRKADELAQEIRRLKVDTPLKPVYLIGKSAGCGLVLAAAEQLPPNSLERILLLSPAVSPTYDLSRALRATRQEVVSFYSNRDLFWLGWGTATFGTADRVYTKAAGLVGFELPANASEETRCLYQRLVQVQWQPDMLLEGYWGGHIGTSMPNFVAAEVAPWLKN